MNKFLIGFAIVLFSISTLAQSEDLPDVQYYGYKIVHHMGAEVKHIEQFGFNTFDHPRIADYRFDDCRAQYKPGFPI